MSFKAQDGIFRRGRPSKYPWQLWTNGEQHVARKGMDFSISTPAFASVLYGRASLNRCKVQTKIEGDSVYFRFYEEDTPTK